MEIRNEKDPIKWKRSHQKIATIYKPAFFIDKDFYQFFKFDNLAYKVFIINQLYNLNHFLFL